MHQIDQIVLDQERKELFPVRDVAAVFPAQLLQGKSGVGAGMARSETVILVEQIQDDVLPGGKQSVEGLAGNAGLLADSADADGRLGHRFQQKDKCFCDLLLGCQCGFVVPGIQARLLC